MSAFVIGDRVALKRNPKHAAGAVDAVRTSRTVLRRYEVLWDDGHRSTHDANWLERTDREPRPIDIAHARWRTEGHPTAAAIVVLYHGAVLVEDANGTKPIGLPGGKREPDETALDCALRELHEETGANLFSLSDSHKHIRCLFFEEVDHRLTALYLATPDHRPKITAGRWVRPSDLLENSRYPKVYARCFAEIVVHLLTL